MEASRWRLRFDGPIVTYTMAGSLVMLPMVFLIYDATGSTSLLHFNLSFDRQLLMWLGFLLVFGIKIPMIPVHLWLPEAHVAAPTALCCWPGCF